MSEHEEVVAGYRCRKCGARKGEPCIYLTPENYRPNRGSVSGALTLERAGKPMKGTHIERRQRYWKDWHARRAAAELAAMQAATPPWLLPLREFDRRENEAMRAWLRLNAVRLFRLRRAVQ